jgi:hypothetical protein
MPPMALFLAFHITCALILSPMSLSPWRGDNVLEAGSLRILTGGAKSSESRYLSEMYLMNSKNRTQSLSWLAYRRAVRRSVKIEEQRSDFFRTVPGFQFAPLGEERE